MKYSDGHDVMLGDLVETDDELGGRVVVLVTEGLAAEGFAPGEWSYLGGGVIVETRKAGLVHYPDDVGASLALAARAAAPTAARR